MGAGADLGAVGGRCGAWADECIQGISQEKATGLAAVAGGLAETLVLFGLTAFLVCMIGGIVLLGKSMARGQVGRPACPSCPLGAAG